MQLKIKRLTETAKLPVRAHLTDAGLEETTEVRFENCKGFRDG